MTVEMLELSTYLESLTDAIYTYGIMRKKHKEVFIMNEIVTVVGSLGILVLVGIIGAGFLCTVLHQLSCGIIDSVYDGRE